MAPSIGVNLRVTGHCNQGGRKYMEDVFSVAYQQTEDEKDLEYAFFGIFDGHGGREAALFAKEHLMDAITKNKGFWSENDDQAVLRAIREGFLSVQQEMVKDRPNWRPTASGLASTAGTTASICFIKRGKIFVGHCGDSGIILGQQDPEYPDRWRSRRLTTDHKPESTEELRRIERSGGKVVEKSGVPRVVWYRPRGGHQGPVRRSTHIDEIPFLAVSRSLGDLWSYNAELDEFIVSPEPDLHVYDVDAVRDRCLILATDGVWNVLNPDMAVDTVFDAERNNEKFMINPQGGHTWLNPSKRLVDTALDRWNMCKLRADNTSIVTVMLDPPGPPRAQVLRKFHGLPPQVSGSPLSTPPLPPKLKTENGEGDRPDAASRPPFPSTSSSSAAAVANKGIAIISRFPNSKVDGEKHGMNLVGSAENGSNVGSKNNRIVHDSLRFAQRSSSKPAAVVVQQPKPYHNTFSNAYNKPLTAPPASASEEPSSTSEIAALEKLCAKTKPLPPLPVSSPSSNPSIQCNEVSSSDTEDSPNPPPLPTRRRKPSGPPLMTRSGQVEAAAPGPPQPPREQPRVAPPLPPTTAATGYGSDSENHQPEKEPATTRSTRSSCVRFANDAAPPTAVKPLSQRNSRRSEPILRPPSQKSTASPRKQLQQPPQSRLPAAAAPAHANPVLTRVLRSRNSLSALSLSPASVITRGRQRLAATKAPARSAVDVTTTPLAAKRKRATSASASQSPAVVKKQPLNPASPAVAAAAAAGNCAKRARIMRNK